MGERFGKFCWIFGLAWVASAAWVPGTAWGDQGQRVVAPQALKTVDVARGHSVEAETKITVALFDGDHVYAFTSSDIQAASKFAVGNDPELDGSVALHVEPTVVTPGNDAYSQFPNRVFSVPGIVVTCTLDLDAPAAAKVGPHVITVSIPSLADLADKYQAPGWRSDVANFTFHINVWATPAALAADPAAKARQAMLMVDPQELIDRKNQENQAKWSAGYDAIEKSIGPRYPLVYATLTAMGLIGLVGFIYAFARADKYKGRLVVLKDEPFPRLCMVCGEPATHDSRQTLLWSGGVHGETGPFPRPTGVRGAGVAVDSLIRLLSLLALHVAGAQPVTLEIPLCDRHRGHFQTHGPGALRLAVLAGLLVTVLSAVAVNVLLKGHDDFAVVLAVVAGGLLSLPAPTWLILSRIRVAAMSRTGVSLLGVDKRFAAAFARAARSPDAPANAADRLAEMQAEPMDEAEEEE